jgi:preprotein translocase subunit SecA
MWDPEGLEKALEGDFAIEVPVRQWLDEDDDLDETGLREKIMEAVEAPLPGQGGADRFRGHAPVREGADACVLDQQWKEHLASMDYLRRGINLRSFAQKKPQQEFKREGFEMFTAMLDSMKHDTMKALARVKIRGEDDVEAVDRSVGARRRCSSSTPMPRPPARSRLPGRPAISSPIPSCARAARSGATSLARVVRARSTSSATASWDKAVSGQP